MRHLLLPGALCALLTTGAAAAPPPPSQLANPQITAPEIIAQIKYLASDELGGRGSGTPGNNLAGDFVGGRFKAIGLKPAGDDGTYFQRFNVITGVKTGPSNHLSVKGAGDESTLRIKQDWMPLSFSKNSRVDGPLVFAGYGISRPDLGYDDYAGLDIRGKIAVILRYVPDGDLNGKFGPFSRLEYRIMTARDKGAAGVLFVTGPATEQAENLGVFTLESASQDCGIPVAFAKRDFVEKLLEPAKTNLRDLQTELAHGKPHSFPIPGALARMSIDVVRQLEPTRNVLGFLPGSDPKLKNQVIVIGAHYDHLGTGPNEHSLAHFAGPGEPTPKPEEWIHHGADDNASGTASVIEIAQYLAANRKKIGRSVLFMAFSGEEMGLLGSDHWVKSPTIPLERVVAMINLDMVGRMKNDTLTIVGESSSPVWAKILAQVDRPYQLKTTQDTTGSAMGGSDQQSFLIKNIPVLFFFTGVHADYHKPSDTWDKINSEGAAKVAKLAADTAVKVSWLKERPQFIKVKEATTTAGGGFRVRLGTVPDYSAEV
jgi:aminopeptidase YwaD